MSIEVLLHKIFPDNSTELEKKTILIHCLESIGMFYKAYYFKKIDTIIKKIMSRPVKENITYDILDTPKSKEIKVLVLKEKQRQMKIGEIWQEVIGNYKNFMNLKQGHSTGLDIINEEQKIIIELKNRTNTDNASSRKANLDKLVKFKKNNPDYTCIYGNINENTEEKTKKGVKKTYIIDDVEIEYMSGYTFLLLIFGDDLQDVIEHLKIVVYS
jgi:hypothetical protein